MTGSGEAVLRAFDGRRLPAVDPAVSFTTRSQSRVLDTLSFALRRQERFLLVTGEVGVGKTVLCRALVEQLERRGAVSLLSTAPLTPAGLYRRLLEDFAATSGDGPIDNCPNDSPVVQYDRLLRFLATLKRRRGGPVVVVDDANMLPRAVVEKLLALSSLDAFRQQPMQMVLVGRPVSATSATLGIPSLDDRVSTRTRLNRLGPDEIADYVERTLDAQRSGRRVTFTPQAIRTLHLATDGVPRLMNLLIERSSQQAEVQGLQHVDVAGISAAAAPPQLGARPRPLRWLARRVS